MEKRYSISEAAKKMGLKRQALYVAIMKGSLIAQKDVTGHLSLSDEDIAQYEANRYSRNKSLFNGEPLYDAEKGTYSLKKAAEYLGIAYSSLYYHMRQGDIAADRKGAAWIFHKEELDKLKQSLEAEALFVNG